MTPSVSQIASVRVALRDRSKVTVPVDARQATASARGASAHAVVRVDELSLLPVGHASLRRRDLLQSQQEHDDQQCTSHQSHDEDDELVKIDFHKKHWGKRNDNLSHQKRDQTEDLRKFSAGEKSHIGRNLGVCWTATFL